LSFREFKEHVKKSVKIAIGEADYPIIDFEPFEPSRPEFGDLSVNVAFIIANKLGLNPLEVAEIIGDKLRIPEDSLIADFEIHKLGYINFKVRYPDLAYRTILDAISKEDYGSLNIGKGK
jgi:arginyl-tRNA synthetase